MPTPNVVPTVGLIGAGAAPRRQIYNGSPVNLKLHSEVNKAGNLAPAMKALGEGLIDLKYRWDGVALKEEFVKRKLELDNAKAEFDNNSATGSYEDMVKAHEKMNAALKGFETFSSKYSNHQATPLMQQLNDYSLEVENGLQASAAKKIKDYETKTLGAETEMAVQDFGAAVRKNGVKFLKDPQYKTYDDAMRNPIRRQIELSGIDPNSELGQHMERAAMSKLYLNEGINLIAHGDLHLSMAWLNRLVETHGITTTDETAWLRAINAEKARREAQARARQLQLTTLSKPAQAYALAENILWPQMEKDYLEAKKAEDQARADQTQRATAFKLSKTNDWGMLTGAEQDMWDRGDYFNALSSMETRLAEMQSAIPTMADFKAPAPDIYPAITIGMTSTEIAQVADAQYAAKHDAARSEFQKEIDAKTKEYQEFQDFVSQARTSVGKEIPITPIPTPQIAVQQAYAIIGEQEELMKQTDNTVFQAKRGMGLSLKTYQAQLFQKYGPEHLDLAEREYQKTLSNVDKEEVARIVGGEGNVKSYQYIMQYGTDEEKKSLIDMYSNIGASGTDLAVSKALVDTLPDDELEMLATGNKAYLADFSTLNGVPHSDLDSLEDYAQLVQQERKDTANTQVYRGQLKVWDQEIARQVPDPFEQQQVKMLFRASSFAKMLKAYSYSSTDFRETSKKVTSPAMHNAGMQAIEEARKQAEAMQ